MKEKEPIGIYDKNGNMISERHGHSLPSNPAINGIKCGVKRPVYLVRGIGAAGSCIFKKERNIFYVAYVWVVLNRKPVIVLKRIIKMIPIGKTG